MSGPVDFNTLGSTFNTTLAVYTGPSLTNLTVVAGNNNDAGGLLTSRVDFNAVAGVKYQVALDGFGGVSGNYQLNWNMTSQLGISELPAGDVQVAFTGVNGRQYGILVSSNLESWATQAIRTMSGSSQQYIDGDHLSARFYRTVLLP